MPGSDQDTHTTTGRQVGGKREKGHLVRGAPASARAHAIGGLPLQTIKNGKEKERSPKRAATVDAFSSRTSRFAASLNDIPGPGTYYQPLELTWHKESISKKGYGAGFISKDKRFPKVPNFRVPGPGAYSTPRDFDQSDRVSPLPPRASSCFAAPLREQMQPPNPFYKPSRAEREIPGPGNYNPRDPMEPSKPSAQAVFKSQTRRLKDEVAAAARDPSPAPGEYEVPAGIGEAALAQAVAAGERITWDGGALPSSMFRSGTTRHTHTTTKSKHPLSIKEHLPVPDFLLENDPLITPGPGSYSVVADNISQRVASHGQRGSSMFVNREGRFPSAMGEGIPGPGTYDLERDRMLKMPNRTRSAFHSKTVRKIEDELVLQDHSRPPGPAFYYPKDPRRMSHHINSRNLWM